MKTIAILRRAESSSLGFHNLFSGDAIVNAANSGLMGGGGVDGAIHAAAGPELLRECRELSLGEAPCDGLPPGKPWPGRRKTCGKGCYIHTVGPVARRDAGEADLLASCYI
jgi:O-acetyl-ADP-ribose deacetylase (regulator of RNase III)